MSRYSACLNGFHREGNLPKAIRKLHDYRYLLLAGTLMSSLAVSQWSVASESVRSADGTIVVAQREGSQDPKEKDKNKGKPQQQQQQKGGQPQQGQPGRTGQPGGSGQQGATGQPGGGQPGSQQ